MKKLNESIISPWLRFLTLSSVIYHNNSLESLFVLALITTLDKSLHCMSMFTKHSAWQYQTLKGCLSTSLQEQRERFGRTRTSFPVKIIDSRDYKRPCSSRLSLAYILPPNGHSLTITRNSIPLKAVILSLISLVENFFLPWKLSQPPASPRWVLFYPGDLQIRSDSKIGYPGYSFSIP